LILEELAKSRERIGLWLALHYLPESEVDGRVIGRCIILDGFVLRFRACSAESAGSEELGSAGREGAGFLNNSAPAIRERLEEFLFDKSPAPKPLCQGACPCEDQITEPSGAEGQILPMLCVAAEAATYKDGRRAEPV
jgi:hypothetical protein